MANAAFPANSQPATKAGINAQRVKNRMIGHLLKRNSPQLLRELRGFTIIIRIGGASGKGTRSPRGPVRCGREGDRSPKAFCFMALGCKVAGDGRRRRGMSKLR